MPSRYSLALQLLIIFVLQVTCNAQEAANCSIHSPFNCSDGNGCVDRFKHFCDGTPQCSDGSDETKYNPALHDGLNGTKCYVLKKRLHTCYLPVEYICDHEIDCTLGEDECFCNHTFQCDSAPALRNFQCLARVQFCDNSPDCIDGTDERKYRYGSFKHQCRVTKTRVTSTCELPSRYVCDETPDCDGGTDECFCDSGKEIAAVETYLNKVCFRCLDGEKIIPRSELCDGVFHCDDLSDECLCPLAPSICNKICEVGQSCSQCEVGQLMCQQANMSTPVKCLNRTLVCDGHYDCPMGEDETYHCNVDSFQLFYCEDNSHYVPKHQRCDNFVDCPDKSDEKNCEEEFFECYPDSVYKSALRKGAYEFRRPRFTESCDRIPTCEDMEDECNATLCGSPLPKYCEFLEGTTGFICPNTLSALIGSQICDGFPTCLETSPELSADELYCPDRFYCHDKGKTSLPIHVALSSVCDARSDCFDQSDELNCSSKTHFYCKSGFPKYIPRDKVCNDIQDCFDGEDECQDCSISPFSSDSFLINSYVLQVFIWIVGIFAIIGNIGVLIHNCSQFVNKRGKLSVIAYNHRLLVTNLALADLLLGIYLLNLGIINTTYTNVYCRNDIQWRASRNCIGIGVLAVISVECSILLLATMASMRLFLVFKPFNSAVRRRYIVMSIIFAWVFALFVALIPLAPTTSDYFTSEIWYQSNPFLTLVDRQEMIDFTRKLWSFEDNRTHVFTNNSYGSLTWRHMIDVVSRMGPDFSPTLYLGYYSAHGVCLPRIFPDPSMDQSWGFSLFLITINFVAFLFMLAMYIAIYRITTEKGRNAGRATGHATSTTLQHKISRIIFTNFCCWIPICVFAFISAGGGEVSSEIYAVSAVVLLPINSAFNPLLYSDLPDLLWQKLIAPTRCGRWIESKKLAREATASRRSISSNKRTSMQHTLRTTLHPNALKSGEESAQNPSDNSRVYENMKVTSDDHTYKKENSNIYENDRL